VAPVGNSASDAPAGYRDYACARVDRLDNGVLEVALHTEGDSLVWGAEPHAQLPELFAEIARDAAVRAVVLTGSGDAFCDRVDFRSFAHLNDAAGWNTIYREGKQLLGNLLRIEVPVIAAVNGPARVHAELALLSDIVVATDDTVFQDKAHYPQQIVPGDGVAVIWPLLLGPNRGRAFLLTGEELSAADAKAAGVIAEIHARDAVLGRAHEIAARVVQAPELVSRYTRVLFTRQFTQLLERDLGYGLALEGLAVLSQAGS
jgi:enoyl-CoA hydratase/carnithine racemase